MDKPNKNQPVSRRTFFGDTLRTLSALGLGSLVGFGARKATSEELVWQLDPDKCVQCGQCATECVLDPSAVKCVHAFDVCGYCKLCGGYFKPDAKSLDTAAENQLCPTGALIRKFVEDPYYEYTIDESLCIGCAKCVKGCGAFGNGSLHLQVRHDCCVNCNECSIAKACPSNAFQRVPASKPYLYRGVQRKDFYPEK
ncbi:4Fe-4S binding protein [candidate division KSB1 bacterium]|nr:4Fe-4S binding protein [candidate division KSB1 bacterium]